MLKYLQNNLKKNYEILGSYFYILMVNNGIVFIKYVNLFYVKSMSSMTFETYRVVKTLLCTTDELSDFVCDTSS